MIYLAPIQGFTDFVYRKAYSEAFEHVDCFFIPYISVKNNDILKKYKREILPLNNPQKKVIPQVLAKNSKELVFLSNILSDLGYSEMNLNMGCPYPMVTKRGKGAGMLPNPELVRELLSDFFGKAKIELSIKLRAGMYSTEEIKELIPILNDFPLTEVILHPRVAKQLYSGAVYKSAFRFAIENSNHSLAYNGDIFCLNDYKDYSQLFPETKKWMIGRGVLMNPFLPAEIKNITISEEEKADILSNFHELVFEGYSNTMDNAGNVLNKMKQFWSYFSYNFPNQRRTFKSIKKCNNTSDYGQQSKLAFLSLY